MPHAMTRHLMPASMYFAYQLWVPTRYVTKHEERCAGGVVIEQIEKCADRSIDAIGVGRPARTIGLERMVPIFDIEGERVHDALPGHCAAARKASAPSAVAAVHAI